MLRIDAGPVCGSYCEKRRMIMKTGCSRKEMKRALMTYDGIASKLVSESGLSGLSFHLTDTSIGLLAEDLATGGRYPFLMEYRALSPDGTAYVFDIGVSEGCGRRTTSSSLVMKNPYEPARAYIPGEGRWEGNADIGFLLDIVLNGLPGKDLIDAAQIGGGVQIALDDYEGMACIIRSSERMLELEERLNGLSRAGLLLLSGAEDDGSDVMVPILYPSSPLITGTWICPNDDGSFTAYRPDEESERSGRHGLFTMDGNAEAAELTEIDDMGLLEGLLGKMWAPPADHARHERVMRGPATFTDAAV